MSSAQLSAYSLQTDESGVYVLKWHVTPLPMRIKLSSTANLLDGNSYRSSVATAMDAWNQRLGAIQFAPQLSQPGAYASGNGINEIVMDSTMDGDAFPAGVLAITLSYAKGDAYSEADIVFNTAYTWNSYRGNLRGTTQDLQRVAIHELGHVLGLDHPDEHNQYVTAIMNSRASNIDMMQSDDIAGAQKLYAAPGFVPANDAFADATPVVLADGTRDLTGSNILGTHEGGEPDHSGSAGRHSIWWQWTAPRAANVTASTLGSDFDTVLAVYTGSGVSALTAIASNDDEETTAQNSTPQRKRTSKVTFAATSGTTYYFAIDGWGSASTVAAGYTGSAAFHLAVVAAPAFSTPPADQSVVAGATAHFSVSVASSSSASSFRWQRLRAGKSAWSDLSEDATFQGTANPTLSIVVTPDMDGDRFRCRATNAVGFTDSAFATLHVLATTPVVSAPPESISVSLGQNVTLAVGLRAGTTVQWQRNGIDIPAATSASLNLTNFGATDAGIYTATASGGGSVASTTTVVGVNNGPSKLGGTASEVGSNIPHPNGNVFDQLLLTGSAATFTADVAEKQITRLSFVDLTGDIVQVELSGPGTVSLALDASSGPAVAELYNQPDIRYMRGNAGIVVTGATQDTHLSVFSVGRANAINQSLFRSDVNYDGRADLAYVAIVSANGKFGGLRAGNASFLATRGLAGIYAPGVQFTGPVYVGDISAYDNASPVLMLGSAAEVQINGGDLYQANGRAVAISGIVQLRFVDGTTSQGTVIPAQPNKARFENNGAEISSQFVVSPNP